jgi:hypothetical protein
MNTTHNNNGYNIVFLFSSSSFFLGLKIEDNGWRIGVGSTKKKEKKERVKVNGQMLGMMMKSEI